MNNCGQCPRILLIDSYDSFTFNISALIAQAIPSAKVYIIRNDELSISQLMHFLPSISAVVVGPGPGSPLNAKDVGVINDLWSISDSHLLPIFGICLGLQSLAISHGATLHRLNTVKHGICSCVSFVEDELFEGVEVANVVRYHSLHVDISGSSRLHELAWANDGSDNGKVTMAIRHTVKPFWAVQYHPESARSDASGLKILKNFWSLATKWSTATNRKVLPWIDELQIGLGHPWPQLNKESSCITDTSDHDTTAVTTVQLELPKWTIPEICEKLNIQKNDDVVLLDSAAAPGRYTIIGCTLPSTTRISYYSGDETVYVNTHNHMSSISLGCMNIWTWVAEFMRRKKYIGGLNNVPFWGGLVGYIGYEAGVSCITSHRSALEKIGRRGTPDICLIFVERSIVIDYHLKVTYLQSLIPEDVEWFNSTAELLRGDVKRDICRISNKNDSSTSRLYRLCMPNKEEYISKVNRAKDYLYAGESYELCLTARTRLQIKTKDETYGDAWDLYKTLRQRNPAPYAAFLKLGKVTLISSSPERFLSFTCPPNQTYRLEPIKGTVRKTANITREVAQGTLWKSKEMAENLMIVDLIRHDLHGIVGGNVQVRKFCSVEEYETVWQSVSVIEGYLSTTDGQTTDDMNGWYALKSCLPPGSMTGAPKKRSVELLQTLEDDERGIYSGVVGYWSVCGGGDWSVIIRSCVKEEDGRKTEEASNKNNDEWHDAWVIGAGGAITALSDPESEWEEMLLKMESVLRAFNIIAKEEQQ